MYMTLNIVPKKHFILTLAVMKIEPVKTQKFRKIWNSEIFDRIKVVFFVLQNNQKT